MRRSNQLVIFILNEQRYALSLSAIGRILRMVEITPLPKAPEIVLGVINMQGQVLPVVDIRRRFRLPEQEVNLHDLLIIAHTSKRTVALVVDTVSGIIERSEQEVIAAEKIIPGMEYVEGVAKLEDGMILIHDLDTFLSLEEEKALDEVMRSK